ncbi:MAG: putative transport system permease protein [Verrucomicrobiota bacterium]|jgi:putative ABC transport system permease protein
MTLGRIVLKSLRQYALSTAVTATSMALASGLMMAIWMVKAQSERTFTQITGGFDAVLGARSSKLQLVLNAVFHLEASPANIAWKDFDEVRKNPGVKLAVPIAMGDNFRGYRIVGTLPEMFGEYAPGRQFQVRAPGRLFDPALREAVVGSFAARRLGLKRGDRFHPYHGLNFDEQQAHAEEYIVVGVLEPSNTPADRVLWIPLEGVQTMSGHGEEHGSELSAVLVALNTPLAGRALEQLYNKQGDRLTFAWPIGATMVELFSKIGWFDKVLTLIAALVAIVAAGSVLASIYNSMNERRRQIAILRALGARQAIVALTVVWEATAIGILGAMLGFCVYFGILLTAARVLRNQTGVVLEAWACHPVLVWAPLGLVGLSALAGLVPALKAYRTEVAEHLLN